LFPLLFVIVTHVVEKFPSVAVTVPVVTVVVLYVIVPVRGMICVDSVGMICVD
jgi:hypothetical protein